MLGFEGRTVLITGANGGLGRAVTKAFLDAGAVVTGVYRRGPAPVENERFSGLEADVSTPEGAAAAVRHALNRTGRLDALVHLVGGFAGGNPVAETSDSVWKQMLDVNLNAAFYTIRAALPSMLGSGRGRIVAVGSRTGVEPAAGLAAYGVSKAALVALVRTVALEVKHTGVTANAVMPSIIDTPANRAANPKADYSQWVKPESIASLILWLASDAAADVNGAVIPIYGKA
ncbi:MAG TPA: SDR family NAD(P)-dependent oxidoreductase [Bryobacteraceae bacterium]|mgnify:CR=1|nr:SDR family NAD(P)-dependent oxidoreductase [Bryobacteraceae bacterium]HOQ47314.1 SDR family NAD(P)-dependent oxidoreductase [Bryobacteraceae bacterium]HPQ16218.1 SDR family NAD(P)-dependent oxidoreductase [Bryobacteraceae bacterium]HPU73901.1 SDR family NAD(P)-dependent oxidoreductase [Bryobacteraceae bacterium]